MRTTVSIEDELLRLVKEQALRTGRTVSQVIEAALRESLARSLARRSGMPPTRTRLVTSPGAPRPGVDLDDSAALLSLMNGGK